MYKDKKPKFIRTFFFIFLLGVISLYIISNFFTQNMIIGKYVNRNFENRFISENPHVKDTLVILTNNQFTSKFYGQGNYKLFYDLYGTHIKLIYKDEIGRTSFTTSIDRLMFLGNPKINLFKDLNQFYEKID